MKTRVTLALLTFAGASLAWQPNAHAIGCISGGVAGAVAGHMAHHGVLGAIGGCVAGHEYHKHQKRMANQNSQNTQPQGYDSTGYGNSGSNTQYH